MSLAPMIANPIRVDERQSWAVRAMHRNDKALSVGVESRVRMTLLNIGGGRGAHLKAFNCRVDCSSSSRYVLRIGYPRFIATPSLGSGFGPW